MTNSHNKKDHFLYLSGNALGLLFEENPIIENARRYRPPTTIKYNSIILVSFLSLHFFSWFHIVRMYVLPYLQLTNDQDYSNLYNRVVTFLRLQFSTFLYAIKLQFLLSQSMLQSL